MARKTKDVTIGDDGGRDQGKTYVLTEMSATQAEKWAWRAFSALAKSGVEIPREVVDLGVIGIFLVGYQAFRTARFEDVEPLLDEMMLFVKAQPSQGIVRPLVENDIEEVLTRVRLRKEMIELHVGFTLAEVASKLTSISAAPAQTPSATPTSQG